MASWKDDIIRALEDLGGVAPYDDIYARIAEIRPSLPRTWKDVVRRRIQDLSSDSQGFKGREDIFYSVDGLGAGTWGLRSRLEATPAAVDLDCEEEDGPAPRALVSTYRVLRDTALARKLKTLHANRCQICGAFITLPSGKRYSEAHHIIPLGREHNGKDNAGNILVLCPNHHVMCDYGVIPLDLSTLRLGKGHHIDAESIAYHNARIFRPGATA